MEEYNRHKIQAKWQKIWKEHKLYSPDLDKAKKPFYNLMMFPYPSAEGLHVGNMYAFTGADIYGRFKRMQGFDVFEPIGLDGFGIHSENYALKVNRYPKEQAKISEKNFYRQLNATGNAFDWQRTLETYDVSYYKWTQWIFVKLFKTGLAYRAKSPVNFCPSCKTVLADEQVVQINQKNPDRSESVGVCERCETPVVKKQLEQWFFKITNYADRLLEGLKRIDWTEQVKIAQRNWIGKKEGAIIKFTVDSPQLTADKISVFTTRPDTLFGATFLALAPEHPLVASLLNPKSEIRNPKRKEIREYVEKSIKKSEQERSEEGRVKTGVFSGLYAINGANGERLPIWVADYVLGEYGTGAIMGVPAHDKRDFDFAKKSKLPIKQVIIPNESRSAATNPLRKWNPIGTSGFTITEAYEGGGRIINSSDWNGWEIPKQMDKVISWLEKKGIGKRKSTYHLRDWLISRQRFWGPPIPVIYCVNCCKNTKHETRNTKLVEGIDYAVIEGSQHAIIPVPEKDLPVLLPDIRDWRPTGTSKSPLASVESFVSTKCPQCGSQAKRETDVSDTFLDSAWYFLRYLATDSKEVPFPSEKLVNPLFDSKLAQSEQFEARNPKQIKNLKLKIENLARRARWLPVKMYIGGSEHAVLHLLYTRFLTMVFKDLGFVNFEEPFTKFRAHGLLISKGAKMSKSKGNIVNPDDYIKKYGSDTLRCYLMFCGRFKQGSDFRDQGIEGMARFLRRVWRLFQQNSKLETQNSKLDNKALQVMHQTIKRVTEDIENLDYNTSISALMVWLRALEQRSVKSRESKVESQIKKNQEKLNTHHTTLITSDELKTFLKLLAPFAPHITEELWQLVDSSKFTVHSSKDQVVNREQKAKRTKYWSIHLQPWPKFDPKLIRSEKFQLVVQVDGKLRDTIEAKMGISQQEAKVLAQGSKKAQKYIENKNYQLIFVKDKLINFVLN